MDLTKGCSLGCSGCFNPQTHLFNDRLQISAAEITQCVASESDIDEAASTSSGDIVAMER